MRKGSMVGALLAASLGVAGSPHDAAACGFFASKPNPERRPSLAYEQALIVHDAVKGREHFIREIVFRASDEAFGFVVPTPTLPEVAKFAKSPFSRLRERFPYEPPAQGGGLGSIGTLGHGAGRGTGPGFGVEVLDQKKIGSFTAFVLAADDAGALTKWLKDNGLVASPETEPWLAHFVKAKFYFVAMRYDVPKPDPAKAPKSNPPAQVNKPTRAEVVRISFDSPRAYYPYFEPEKPAGAPDEPRLLEVWLATQGSASQPLAIRKIGDKAEWLRPFAEGERYADGGVRDTLATTMDDDAKLLPEGQLTLQRFMDQKRRRTGWGDVVFTPESKDPKDTATAASLKKLAAVLDPTLLPGDSK